MGSALGAFFSSIVLALLSSNTVSEPCPPFKSTELVKITNVVDGDTVHLEDGRKVRLIGINTPEIDHTGNNSEPFSLEARVALSQFLGKRAQLLTDQQTKDRHGRTLAHLYNLTGESAEAHLLKNGLAWHIAIPPNLTLADCLAEQELRARQQEFGLWGDSGIAATPATAVSTGGFQRVVGTVTDVKLTKKAWWLNLGQKLSVVIYPKDQYRFNREQLNSLAGKQVEVRGWVYPSRSKKHQPWRIKLETPFAITLPGT